MGAVKVQFAHFGDFDSFDIIRSTSSMEGMDNHLLPTPIATNLPSMIYIDRSVNLQSEYFYKVRAWKGIDYSLSDEIYIATPAAFTIETNLRAVYSKNEYVEIPIEIESIDSTPIFSCSVISGSLPAGLSLTGNTLSGIFELDGGYEFTIKVEDTKGRYLSKSYSVQVSGTMVVDSQFDTNIDRIGGTWALGSGNALVSDIVRKAGKKVLRFGNGTNRATAVASFSRTLPRAIFNGDFTVTGWIYRGSVPTNPHMVFLYGSTSSNTNRNSYQLNGHKQAQWYRDGNGTTMNLIGQYTGPRYLLEEWIHVAEVRKSNIAYLFVDGQLVAQQTVSGVLSSDVPFLLGGARAGGVMTYTQPLWIDEIKVYQGVGLWTQDYDPLTEW